MSKKLREILKAKEQQPEKFTTGEDRQILENIDGKKVPTGYYQDQDGEYYTYESWKERQLALQKEAEKQKRVYTVPSPPITDETPSHTPVTNPNKKLYIIMAIVFVIGFAITFFGIKFFKSSDDARTEEQIVVEEKNDNVIEPFPNAVIVGNDVRFRNGPSTQDSIIGIFKSAGEIVEVMEEPKDTLSWAKIKRDDGLTGWVFGKYIEVQE